MNQLINSDDHYPKENYTQKNFSPHYNLRQEAKCNPMQFLKIEVIVVTTIIIIDYYYYYN